MAKDSKGMGEWKMRSRSEDYSRRRRSPSKGASGWRHPEDYEMRSRSVDSSRQPARGRESRGEKDRYREKPRRNQTQPSWSKPEKKGYDARHGQGYNHRGGGDLPPPYDNYGPAGPGPAGPGPAGPGPAGPGPAGPGSVGPRPAEPGGYSHNVTVVTVPVQPQPLANPPKDYVCFNIFMTLFCCIWLGIAGIICGQESKTASKRGDKEKAVSSSHYALGFGLAALLIGLVEVGIVVGVVMSSRPLFRMATESKSTLESLFNDE